VVTPGGLEHRHTNIDMQITNGKMCAPTLILASLEYLENIEIFVMFIDALTKKKNY
jgi:ABC-type Fe3+-citrate transport system substrate-binding protein